MRPKWLFLSVFAVAAGIGGGALSLHWKHRAPAPAPPTAAPAAPAPSEITLSGKLRPQNILPIAADVDGDIDAFLADVGDAVSEGQLLARIGSSGLETQREAATAAVTAAEAAISRAQASVTNTRVEDVRAEADRARAREALDKAQAVYERQQTLNNAGATPRLTWEKAQRDFEAAQQEFKIAGEAARLSAEQLQSALNAVTAAERQLLESKQQLEAARNNLESGELRAPVAGTIVARNGEVGKPAGDDVFEIATDLNALEVPLEPEPAILARLRPGQPALVLILDLQAAGIPGAISEIDGNQVLVQFNCTLPGIRPGMRADVRLKLP